jgi:hypothetical protein
LRAKREVLWKWDLIIVIRGASQARDQFDSLACLTLSISLMSRVFNVSDDFGKLLLQGWVCGQTRFPLRIVSHNHNLKTPSDQTCLAEGCRGIPLLRSPEGHTPITWFCTSCKGDGSDESSPSSVPPNFLIRNSPWPRRWSESIGTATSLFT